MTNNTPDYNNLYFEEKDCKNCPYTDEYCASGDCNEIQAKDVACNEISLTEKWKKGELPSGKYYYISTIYYPEIIQNYVGGFYDWEDGEIEQILAPVPTFDEWKEMVESEAKSHLQADSYYNKILELKDLLKECRHIMQIEMDFASCQFEKEKLIELIENIDEVLNESPDIR